LPSVKVVDILDRASILLQDASNVRYPNAELLKFFNDAQREINLYRPDSTITNATFACADGSKQELPAAAMRLADVTRNINGTAITQVDRQLLDESLPTWHETVAGANGIEHFVYDPTDPKVFYVYPKAVSGTHSIHIIYPATISNITITSFASSTTTITVDDTYANALLDYIMYRCYQKDSEFAGNPQKAQMHYQMFSNSIGIKTQGDAAVTPSPEAA